MFKKMSLLAVLLLVGFSTVYFAQGRGRMSPEERTKQLTEQLKLDSVQVKKVEAIMKKSQDEITKIFESGGGFGDPATRDKMMKIRQDSNDAIMKLLNDKQKTEFKKIIEEQRKRMQERMQNRGN